MNNVIKRTVPFFFVGNTLSTVGNVGELAINYTNGDYKFLYEETAFWMLEYGSKKLANKLLPGYGKKLGEEGFNLGTEILEQGRKLKLSLTDRVIDKALDTSKETDKQNEGRDEE